MENLLPTIEEVCTSYISFPAETPIYTVYEIEEILNNFRGNEEIDILLDDIIYCFQHCKRRSNA